MRIACAYLPSFPLQLHIRQAPHLAAEPLAITQGLGAHVCVAACSRAAWDHSVRPGMRLSTAVARCPSLRIVSSSLAQVQAAAQSITDVLSALSPAVEAESAAKMPLHLSVFFRVPRRIRGSSFGESAITLLSRHGYRARIGIADDRFTAFVAACVHEPSELFAQTVTTVPRGGSAAFLAPQPLELLPMSDDVRGMLAALGIRTLGAFAELPPPTIAQPGSSSCFDLQDLARGEGSDIVRASQPPNVVGERIELREPASDVEPLSFALRRLSDRIAARLAGRQLGAGKLRLTLTTPNATVDIGTRLPRPSASPGIIVDTARRALRRQGAEQHVSALELAAIDLAPHSEGDAELPLRHAGHAHQRAARRTTKAPRRPTTATRGGRTARSSRAP